MENKNKNMIGEVITINGIKLLTLDEIDNNPLVMAIDLDIETKFDEDSNNYAKSMIKVEIEEWFASTGLKAIERTIDLQTMDGYKGYGTLKVEASLLTFDEYRKYADIIIPHIGNYFWLATGWGRPKLNNWASDIVCRVSISGSANDGIYSGSRGLGPIFILDRGSITTVSHDLSEFSTEELLAEIAGRVKKSF